MSVNFYDKNKAGAPLLLGLDIVEWSLLLIAVALIALFGVLA